MKSVDFSLIVPGSFAYGDQDVFSAMQDYYTSMIIASLKDKISNYDATRVYVFGKEDFIFDFGLVNQTFQSPTGGFALLNGVIYELPIMASPMVGGTDYLVTQIVPTTKIFSDNTSKNFLLQKKLIVGTSSDIDINKITPIEIVFNLDNGVDIGLGTSIKLTKSGKAITLNSLLNDSGGGTNNIGLLPVGMRPSNTMVFKSTNTTPRTITINTDGTIVTLENEAGGHKFAFTFLV